MARKKLYITPNICISLRIINYLPDKLGDFSEKGECFTSNPHLSEIAQHTWEKIYDSEGQNSFGSDILFFPGHLDMQPVTHVKKIKFLPNLSKRDGGCL